METRHRGALFTSQHEVWLPVGDLSHTVEELQFVREPSSSQLHSDVLDCGLRLRVVEHDKGLVVQDLEVV